MPVLMLLVLLVSPQDYPKVAPFSGVKWKESMPIVRIEDQWFELLSIDQSEIGEIMRHCQSRWPSRWQKRFSEDLTEVLSTMGHEPGPKVDLKVKDPESGDVSWRRGVAMTREKRARIWEANKASGFSLPTPSSRGAAQSLTREQAQADLVQLGELLDLTYSYRHLKGVDLDSLIGEAYENLDDPITSNTLGLEIMKIVARFGDGHTRVAGSASILTPGSLPLALDWHEDRLVALKPEGGQFLDPKRPYLVAIDGVDIEEWIEAATGICAQGSEALVQQTLLWRMTFVNFGRDELGLERRPQVSLTLANALSKDPVTIERPVSSRAFSMAQNPQQSSRIINGEIGYLRIPQMSSGEPFRRWLQESMASLQKTQSMIIDVRGNGGGSREALLNLLPYFMSDGKEPLVVNVASCRLDEGQVTETKEGYLANRYCYPAGWSGWNSKEKRALKRFARSFKPQWQLPVHEFSEWHYLMISRDRYPAPFHYEGPVAVLIDRGCFSATDIFVGAFAELEQVALIGQPTGGGSGRSRTRGLAHSGLRVRLSSMASFRPSGALYDGNGIEPDIETPKTLSDVLGTTDSQLDRAIQWCQER